MEKRKHIFWELTLILGSVFVFRSLWILMDRYPIFNTINSLVIFLIVGMILTAIAFYKIVHSERLFSKH